MKTLLLSSIRLVNDVFNNLTTRIRMCNSRTGNWYYLVPCSPAVPPRTLTSS